MYEIDKKLLSNYPRENIDIETLEHVQRFVVNYEEFIK